MSLLLFLSAVVRYAAASILFVLVVGACKSLYASFLATLPTIKQRVISQWIRARNRVLLALGRDVDLSDRSRAGERGAGALSGKGDATGGASIFFGGKRRIGVGGNRGGRFGLDTISENDPYLDDGGDRHGTNRVSGVDDGGDGHLLSTPKGLAFTTNIGSSMRYAECAHGIACVMCSYCAWASLSALFLPPQNAHTHTPTVSNRYLAGRSVLGSGAVSKSNGKSAFDREFGDCTDDGDNNHRGPSYADGSRRGIDKASLSLGFSTATSIVTEAAPLRWQPSTSSSYSSSPSLETSSRGNSPIRSGFSPSSCSSGVNSTSMTVSSLPVSPDTVSTDITMPTLRGVKQRINFGHSDRHRRGRRRTRRDEVRTDVVVSGAGSDERLDRR